MQVTKTVEETRKQIKAWKKEGKTEQEIDAGVEKMLREEYAVFCKKYRLNL